MHGEEDDAYMAAEEAEQKEDEEMKDAKVEGDVKDEEMKEEENEYDKEKLKAEGLDGEGGEAHSGADAVKEEMAEELDAPEDSRKKVDPEKVMLSIGTATLNTLPSKDGKLLMSLTEGGFSQLMAGVSVNVGLKAGRYMFEVKLTEELRPASGSRHSPRPLIRLGFSTAGAGPLLDDADLQVWFDSEGMFCHQRPDRRSRSRLTVGRDSVLAVMVNLQGAGANVDTISLFKDGQRVGQAVPLPDSLRGATLFPTINYRNATLQVNLGPSPRRPFPFICRMLTDCAVDDVEFVEAQARSDGKHEVLFPVGIPDQGLFDWLDGFLEESKGLAELSDRKILEWMDRSVSGYRTKYAAPRGSVDKPIFDLKIPSLDDYSVHKTLYALAPALARSLVVMDLRSNLVAAERQKVVAAFPASRFHRVALVVMGEPPEEVKSKVHAELLAAKVRRVDKEREHDKKEKELKELREKKIALEARVAQESEGRDGDEGPQDADPAQAEETKEAEEEAEVEQKVELTEEEKAQWFIERDVPDMRHAELAKSYVNFSVPSNDEGFDEIRCVWQPLEKCTSYLKAWVLTMKKTQRAEDLEPSQWFNSKYTEWNKITTEWKRKQHEARDKIRRRKDEAAKRSEKKSEDNGDGFDADEQHKEDGEPEDSGEVKQDDENIDVDLESLEIMEVKDILDVGGGKPLFYDFVYEDWTLLNLRFEFHLLLHAFRHDLDDEDRPSFPVKDLCYYYEKYYGKSFNIKQYGLETHADMLALIKDSIAEDSESGLLTAPLPDDTPFDKFVLYTEDHRQERQRCIDAGDETANLKFSRPSPPPRASEASHDRYRGGAGGYDRGREHSRQQMPSRHAGKGGYGGGGVGGSGGYGDSRSRGGTGGSSYPGAGAGGARHPPAPPRGSYGPVSGAGGGAQAPVGSSSGGGGKRYTPPPPTPYPAKQGRYEGGGHRAGGGSGGHSRDTRDRRDAGGHGSRGGTSRGAYGGSAGGGGGGGRSYR